MKTKRPRPMTTEEMAGLCRSYMPELIIELRKIARETTSEAVRKEALAILKQRGIPVDPDGTI